MAKVEAMKKEASELLKIASESRKELRDLFSSAEKQHGEFTNSKDPSDHDFLQIALNLDRTKNILVLILSKLDSAATVDSRTSEEDEVIQAGPPDSQKILLDHLDRKLQSISHYFLLEEKELSGMEEEISGIITEVSQLATTIKTFTGTRRAQFLRYSEQSQQLFGVEVKLERVCFKLVGVSSTLENSEQSQLEEAKRLEAGENNKEVRLEEARLKVEDVEEDNDTERASDEKKSSTSTSDHQEGSLQTNLTVRQPSMVMEDTAEEVSSAPEEEDLHLPCSREDPNTEVSPSQLERSVITSAPASAPASSSSHCEQLRKVKQLQIENLKNNLGVYSSFSLSPGTYQNLNVFYVEGTPSKFWLSIDNRALTNFNYLIKVLSFVFSFSAPVN